LRNKKVAFVGDSVGLQQFFSFLCLISPTPRTHEPYIESRDADYKFNWTTGWRGWQGSAYRFPETNTTVLLKWTTSLCHVARKDWANESAGQAAHLDQPDEFLRQHMEEMDVIIMNTGHRWNINKMQEYGWHFHLGGIPVPPETHKEMEGEFNVPMRTVLRSSAMWAHRQLQAMAQSADWLELSQHVDCIIVDSPGTLLAYGQTSSCKTFTMKESVIPLCIRQVFGHIEIEVTNQHHSPTTAEECVRDDLALDVAEHLLDAERDDAFLHGKRVRVAVPYGIAASPSRHTQGDGGRIQRAHAHRAAHASPPTPSFLLSPIPPSPALPSAPSNKMQEYGWQFHLGGLPVPPDTHRQMEGDFNVPMRTVLPLQSPSHPPSFHPLPHPPSNKMQEYGWQFHLHGAPVPPESHKEMEGDFNVPMLTVLRSTALWAHCQLQAMAQEREGRQVSGEGACFSVYSSHLHTHPQPPPLQKQDERIWMAVPPGGSPSATRHTQGDGGDFNVPMRTVLRSTAMWVHRHLQEISEERERRRLAAMREGERREGAEGEEGERALPLVLLVTRSPAHFMDGQWNTGGGCDKLQSMLTQEETDRLHFQSRDWNAEAAVEGTAVRLLNITALSALRPEAHLSRWYDKDGKAPGQQDCVHWCLPGVPDAWNELLFWEIVRSGRFPLPGEARGRGDRDGSTRLIQDT
ncbi:unnamed protein product, partial [Closterium sp. Naga37s-1]